MICPFCNKNEATIHYTEVIDNQVKKTHMCEECAKKKGIEIALPFSFGDILAALSKGIESIEQTGQKGRHSDLACPVCGLSMAEFIKQGRLGCAQCYQTFAEPLKDILSNVQKAPNHVGKIPKAFRRSEDKQRRIAELEADLHKAVSEERYEDCVPLRDEIRRLKHPAPEVTNA